MATILRSSKYVRGFAEFATKLGFSHIKADVRVSLLSQRHSVPSTFAKSLATQVAAKQLDNDSNLENSLRILDSDIKRYGRTSRMKLKRILDAFQAAKSVTSTQALMVLRCCGNLVPDELPEARSELVNQVWKSLENSGIQLDLSHYNALLRVYNENEYAFSPAEILAEMERKGIEPNKLTYQRLINRYCQQGDIEGASKILEFMREKGVSVSENIFTSLVRGHSEANDMVSAADILSVMRQAGLEPSADTYKELLCGYAKHGDIESITRTLSDCESKNVHLLDTDFLDVIFALACNGHGAHVATILSVMPKEVGYVQDAVNHVLKLVNAKHVDIAMQILSTIPNRDKGQTGGSVIKQLAKADLPTPKLVDICQQIESKGINSRALLLALESTLGAGNVEASLALLKALSETNAEIREHYFWPILITLGKSKDNTGMNNLIRSMRADYRLNISGETLTDYVIPNKTGEPHEILAELLLSGLPPGLIAHSIVYNLVTQMKLKEAANFATQHVFHYNPAMFCRPLVTALAHTKDVTSFVTILRHIYQSKSNSQNIRDQEVAVDNILEPYIIDVAVYIKDDKPEILTSVLEELIAGGYSGMSDACLTTLKQRIGNRMTPELSTLLNRFKPKSYGFAPLATDPSVYYAEIARLEGSADRNNSNEQTAIGSKKRLLYLYSRVKDLPNMEKTISELKELGVEFTNSMYAHILDVYINLDILDKTEEYLTILRQTHPGFILLDRKLINYIVLLVKNDRTDDAIQFLQHQLSSQDKDSDETKIVLQKLLNAVAELGEAKSVNAIFDMLLQNEYIDLSNQNLGPLIKVHMVREDLNEAMNVFEKVCETYHCTPVKNELAKKLIQAEDATALQRLTDLSTEVHGEANSLYDLVQSFIECDCLRQAKKILEIPALRSKFHRLKSFSTRYRETGMTNFLERIILVIKDMPYWKTIPQFYNDLLCCYDKENNWEKGLSLMNQMEEEEIEPSDFFRLTLADLLRRNNQPVGFAVPESKRDSSYNQKRSQLSKSARSSSTRQLPSSEAEDSEGNDNLKTNPKTSTVNAVTEASRLIGSLVENGKLHEAFEVLESLIEKNTYPRYGNFRFFVRSAGRAGEVELLTKLSSKLSPLLKKIVDFENSLCKAYIVAGKPEEYIDILEKHLETTDESDPDKVPSAFPMSSIKTLLRSHPELTERYTKFAEKHAAQGITQPINALWIYYFAQGAEEADKIWSEYLIKSPMIRFYSIIRTAQQNNNPELAKRLLKTLETSPFVSDPAKGFVYSALIKLYYLSGNYQESVNVLREALKSISVDSLPKNTLEDMKSHLAAKGLALPADIFLESQTTEAREQLTI